MRKVALAATLVAWAKLIFSGRKRVSEAPGIGPLLDALEGCLARANALDYERLRLQAEQQRITRELRETRAEGDELMVRVRSALKGASAGRARACTSSTCVRIPSATAAPGKRRRKKRAALSSAVESHRAARKFIGQPLPREFQAYNLAVLRQEGAPCGPTGSCWL